MTEGMQRDKEGYVQVIAKIPNELLVGTAILL
jgi:hypothetical protein